MYEQMKRLSLAEQVEVLTRKLISIPSINHTEGEVVLADAVKEILLSFPYFQCHPEHVWEQPIPGDGLSRKNIFAFVQGKKQSAKTVIFHAHLDTVGIDDFGAIKHHAFQSDALQTYFSTYEFDKEVQKDAQSDEWLFGRGSVDMQSGIAVHLANVLYFSERIDELNGNILFMVNPDEESQHIGMKAAVSELLHLREEKGLDFIVAINDDFISPLYDGDNTRYIYTGAAGKLLPSFFIFGREAHVGDTLTGVDPNVIAAEITRRIHNNVDLCEDIENEIVLPPTCLFQRDNKFSYNVQTATSSYVYFNYFLYKRSAKEVMEQLLTLTKAACRDIQIRSQKQYEQFLQRTNLKRKELSWDIEVVALDEYVERLSSLNIDVESVSKAVAKQYKDVDLRILSFKIVEVLNELDPIKKPRVIVFFAPPYLPHNYLRPHVPRERIMLQVVEQVLKQMEQRTGERFEMKRFFPYLADGSYLSIHESDEEIAYLLNNFPMLGNYYSLPVQKIRELNVPSINMGVYGKDGHKWTERVYKPYSFGVLPALIQQLTETLLTIE
jgi:arginine utilization protein RocB